MIWLLILFVGLTLKCIRDFCTYMIHRPFATHGPWHMPPSYEIRVRGPISRCPIDHQLNPSFPKLTPIISYSFIHSTQPHQALMEHCPDCLSTLPESHCDEWAQATCAARVERGDFVQGVNFACDWEAMCSQDMSSRPWTASMDIEVRD